MTITVTLYGRPREVVGEKTIEWEPTPATVTELFEALVDDHSDLEGALFDADGSLQPSINVLKNGSNVGSLDDGESEIEDGDEVTVMMAIHGG